MSQQAVQVFPNQGGTEIERGLKEEPAASSPKLHCEMFEAWRKLEKAQHDIKQLKKKQLSRGHGEREPREREETQCKACVYSYPGFPGFPNFG